MTLRTLSAHNARVVRLGKLSARRRVREAEDAFVIDGGTLIGEALAARVAISEVFVDTERLDEPTSRLLDTIEARGGAVFGVDAEVLRRATDPVHPQHLAAIASRVAVSDDVLTGASAVLVLVGVADPGNAGTLVRSAVAAGFDAVITTPGSVELLSPKALRASAGTIFHVPTIAASSTDAALAMIEEGSLETVAATLEAATPYDEVDLTGPVAVLIGNEAHGLDPDLAAAADRRVRIPMAGPAESLNAAMAGTLLCFEVLRQRRAAGRRAPAEMQAVVR